MAGGAGGGGSSCLRHYGAMRMEIDMRLTPKCSEIRVG